MRRRWVLGCTAGGALLWGFAVLRAQEQELPEHAECIFFNQPKNQRRAEQPLLTELTTKVSALRGAPTGERAAGTTDLSKLPTIDRYLFQAMKDASVPSTPITNDYEFIRRATLDLTGRAPTPERVQSFVADPSADKRAKLVDDLLASTSWLDKWTMYFGDLFKNASRTTQVLRFDEGVKAFNDWIRASLAGGKGYNHIATELISSSGENSYTQGDVNWLVGGIVTGGPVQDIWDQQTVNVATTFLGIAHVNCLLCHNGRGHLDSLSLWGKTATRMQGWQLASFLSHTETRRTVTGQNVFYWGLLDNARFRTDYPLNTTTGNRPARTPAGSTANVAPVYLFSGRGPAAGENYRVALAREVTADPQFSRAAVNYIWKEFFGVGLVDPPDQFDPARLDPDNPPEAPWTLQPSNARLLNTLAQDFANNGYNLKTLMKWIVTSQAYQLSSRYDGQWNPEWDQYFARKFVRRLWAEELHDAIVQTSGIPVTYNVSIFGPINWAIQFPETDRTPNPRLPITSFLDAFLRGNRDEEERRSDGSIAQALNLMNDDFVTSRVKATAANGLVAKNLGKGDEDLVNTLFLTVLSRYPTAAEKTSALSSLRTGNRTQEAENLLWTLYNKVDFFFNY
ncbi:MAG: DUF1553 domain-containing protein [Acidobacteria bacterium]|nr:DUF1553 domain-containing protein [Acidobacteriota bacterium]